MQYAIAGHERSCLLDIPRIAVIAAKAACMHNTQGHYSSVITWELQHKIAFKKSLLFSSLFLRKEISFIIRTQYWGKYWASWNYLSYYYLLPNFTHFGPWQLACCTPFILKQKPKINQMSYEHACHYLKRLFEKIKCRNQEKQLNREDRREWHTKLWIKEKENHKVSQIRMKW